MNQGVGATTWALTYPNSTAGQFVSTSDPMQGPSHTLFEYLLACTRLVGLLQNHGVQLKVRWAGQRSIVINFSRSGLTYMESGSCFLVILEKGAACFDLL